MSVPGVNDSDITPFQGATSGVITSVITDEPVAVTGVAGSTGGTGGTGHYGDIGGTA